MNQTDALGFHSLSPADETTTALPVEGSLPGWLRGTLLRNGPGAFELGGDGVDHWFDGLAMLQRFTFADGGIEYANRFLRTNAFETAQRGEFSGGFATGESTLRERLWGMLVADPYDNTNVIVERHGDRYFALTETPVRVEVDPMTLETLGTHRYAGDAPAGRLACAHVRRDPGDDGYWNFETDFGRRHAYHVHYTRHPGHRDHVATVETDRPAYMHSFALTRRYVVLTAFPFVVDPLDFLKPGRQGPFVEQFEWTPDRGTRLVVIERASGDVVADTTTDPYFGFHHANAYEDGEEVVMDLETVPDAESVATLSLERLRRGDLDVFGGRIERFRFDPHDSDPAVTRERLYDGTALPTVSPERQARRHRYLYAQRTDQPVTEWPTGVVKVDTDDRTAIEYDAAADHFGEPVFVPRPGGDREDQGVVLTVGLDTDRGRSLLVVLDAERMVEVARAPLPHAAPFDFHGRFFPEVGAA